MLSLLFTSCEKVVNIDLNEAAPQHVIEAELFEGTHPFRVMVAFTTDFYGKQPQKLIDDAIVTLSDSLGADVVIPSVGDGKYELPAYTAVSGRTYHLKVVVSGEEFTASSTMPRAIPIDSISMIWNEASGFRKEGYDVATWFKDPAGEDNYYRIIRTENDTLRNEGDDLYLLDDVYNDGKSVKANFFERYDRGEKIEVQLITMPAPEFDFFTSLREILNNQNGPAPANPNTNLKGGALGYFGTFGKSESSIVLP